MVYARRVLRSVIVLAMLLALAVSPRRVRADGDYDPESDAWNGLSGLLAVARELDLPARAPTRVALSRLRAADAIIVLHPTTDLPVDDLIALLRTGGRVLVADDFGTANEFLATFRIQRGRPSPSSDIERLRANPNLLVARPRHPHPLNEGITALVTNHAATVMHPALEPIFVVGEDPICLTGAVGEGRLVTLGDPSILINNMLELNAHRRFATNLLRYLARPGGEILIVHGGTLWSGHFGDPRSNRPLHDLRNTLERASRQALPAPAVRVLAVAIGLLVVLFTFGIAPRRTPYRADAMLSRTRVHGGLAGRIAWFRDSKRDLHEPMLAYKFELETELARLLGAPPRTPSHALATRIRESLKPGDPRVQGTAALLSELEGLAASGDTPVVEAQLRSLVLRGEALLASLAPPPTGPTS